jgi:hypothetical protein
MLQAWKRCAAIAVAVAVGGPGLTAMAGLDAITPALASTCISSSYMLVSGEGVGTYKLNPDNYNGGTADVCNSDGDADFSIQSQTASDASPVAYPNLDAGCNSNAGGNCSSGWTQEDYSSLGSDPNVSFATDGSPDGSDEWDALVDNWWAPSTRGCPNVEVGVMFDGANLSAASGTVVTINGTNYYYKTVSRSNASCSWTYYLFRQQTFTSSISSLNLQPIFAYVYNNGTLPSTDLWRYCGGGFELWSGGAGLETTSFSVSQ